MIIWSQIIEDIYIYLQLSILVNIIYIFEEELKYVIKNKSFFFMHFVFVLVRTLYGNIDRQSCNTL